jgi:hypothetical protein
MLVGDDMFTHVSKLEPMHGSQCAQIYVFIVHSNPSSTSGVMFLKNIAVGKTNLLWEIRVRRTTAAVSIH